MNDEWKYPQDILFIGFTVSSFLGMSSSSESPALIRSSIITSAELIIESKSPTIQLIVCCQSEHMPSSTCNALDFYSFH